ncbi:MAG TPA: radical SAM protein [Elusimicrobiota bacterium]|nr:radical SAM protein [Elusimicrobiota bacterium]
MNVPNTTVEPGSPRDLRLKLLAEKAEDNIRRNNEEYAQRRVVLASTPQNIFVQINAVCNANCVFCSKGYDYPLFRLDDWLKHYGDKITPALAQARQVILTGSGEFLGLPDAQRILEYFNSEFPHVEKYVATNATYLTPKIVDLICSGSSKYVVQLSLHASRPEIQRVMMRYGAYDRVQKNIRALMEARDKKNVNVLFMFIMTTLNIDDLPDFIRYASRMGADKVVCGYFYIYESNQKYLSLYFMQEKANQRLEEARRVADELGITLQAPPKFGLTPEVYKAFDVCQEPWYQFMMSNDGYVLPCDAYGSFPREENLNVMSFSELWNGPTYRKIRTDIVDGKGCLLTCSRHNPKSVNDWNSHVIHRFKEDRQIIKEHHESLRRP